MIPLFHFYKPYEWHACVGFLNLMHIFGKVACGECIELVFSILMLLCCFSCMFTFSIKNIKKKKTRISLKLSKQLSSMAGSLKKPIKMSLHVLVFYKIIVLAFSTKKKKHFAYIFWFHKTIYKTHWT